MKYQIYCDRGNGLELDGCWGSENAAFETLAEANDGAKHLAGQYPDCAWVVCDSHKTELSRIPATISRAEKTDFLRGWVAGSGSSPEQWYEDSGSLTEDERQECYDGGWETGYSMGIQFKESHAR